jgi:hypothetical protein
VVEFRSLVATLLLLAACPPPEPPPAPIPPVSAGKVRVRVFTDPAPVKTIAAAGKYTFVATDDAVQRWDAAGQVVAMSADHGLPGEHIVALGADAELKRVWILTDGGLGFYDATAEVYSEVSPPPPGLGIDYASLAHQNASIAGAADGGAWIGTQNGLLYVSERGGWLSTSIKDPVRAIVRDRASWMWIATKTGLIGRKPNGDMIKLTAANGCEVAEPRLLVDAPGDRILAIGTDGQGHERIAIGKGTTWASYRTLPELTWDFATRRGNTIVAMANGRVFRIAAASETVRPLARDGVRFVPLAGGAPSEWVIDPLDLVLPPDPTALGAVGDQLLVGTRDMGTARYGDADTHPHDWLRRKQMFEDAATLSVACAKQNDCWISTGARQAWHWTGDHFIPGGPDHIVLAVARDPSGPIYALHRAVSEKEIHLSRIDGTKWTQITKVALTTPGDAPEVSFARFASSGSLWVGLRYRDGAEHRAYGVAIVEPSSGKVAYHRTEAAAPDKSDKKPKMLPIPVGVVDADVRGDVAWFATNEGIARLAGGQVTLWTEADGLRSELARAVTIEPGGGVIVATGAGAGVWDGKAWDFPPALRFEINDVVATRSGQIWMATERGIAAWDGKKVRRVDTRRGLAENEVLDVCADNYDRVWARGPSSLTLISQ